MDFYESLFITTLVSFIAFIAWRVWNIESNHLRHLDADVKEIKTDIKWLIKFHEDKEKD